MRLIYKKIIIVFGIVVIAFFSIGASVLALENISDKQEEIVVHFFDDRLCPVCQRVKEFIQGLEQDYPEMVLNIYPISDTVKLREIAKKYGVEDYRIMSPTIFIGNPPAGVTGNFFQFRDFTSLHEEMIIRALEGEIVEKEDYSIIRIPLLNIEIDIKDWSLLLIAFTLGSLDGLNICSIGALILIISIVMVLDSRKKIFIYGGLYIITAVVVYGVLVFIWGGIVETIIGQLAILRIIVGLAAFFGGLYFAKEFWRFFKYGPACKFSDSALVRKATNKLQKAFESSAKGGLLLAGSVMSFAAVIILVELPCSIGLPIAFTGILLEAGIAPRAALLTYLLYIKAYLFFFMLIELVIFVGAVLTKKIWFGEHKVITWISFIGALLLFYLAFYYLFS